MYRTTFFVKIHTFYQQPNLNLVGCHLELVSGSKIVVLYSFHQQFLHPSKILPRHGATSSKEEGSLDSWFVYRFVKVDA